LSKVVEFWEDKVHVNGHPDLLIQALAWDGVIFLDEQPVRISDWNRVNSDVKSKLRSILLTTFKSVKNGKNKPNPDGSYDLVSISMIGQIEEGGFINVPDIELLKNDSSIVETIDYF